MTPSKKPLMTTHMGRAILADENVHSSYRADFLWGFEDGSVEEAGYEFANARTETYRKEWWEILVARIKAAS